MSLFNEILVGRYNALLHKLLTMKDGAPAPTLATDISAGITLENDRPEWAYLAGEARYCAPLLIAALAANFNTVGIRLAAPGVLAVVEGILINNENAAVASFNIKQGGGPIGSLFRAFPTDARFLSPNTQRSSATVGSNQAVAPAGNLYGRVTLPAGGSIYLPTSFILTDATVTLGPLVVETAVVNSIASVTYFWRERVLEPSETR